MFLKISVDTTFNLKYVYLCFSMQKSKFFTNLSMKWIFYHFFSTFFISSEYYLFPTISYFVWINCYEYFNCGIASIFPNKWRFLVQIVRHFAGKWRSCFSPTFQTNTLRSFRKLFRSTFFSIKKNIYFPKKISYDRYFQIIR